MELCGGEEEYGSHFLCSSQKSQSLFPFPGLMSGSLNGFLPRSLCSSKDDL